MNVSNQQMVPAQPEMAQAETEAVPAVHNGVLPVPATEAIISPGPALITETRRFRRKVWVWLLSIGGAAPIAAGVIGAAFPGWAGGLPHSPVAAGGFILFETGLCGAVAVAMRRARVRLGPLVQLAAEAGDIASVGALIDALEFEDATVRAAAVDALCRLLPPLTPDAARQLNVVQRTRLRFTLRIPMQGVMSTDLLIRPMRVTPRAVDFRIGVVHALAAAGDARALPAIERLAAMPARSPDEARVAEAARQAVELLREQMRLTGSGAGLLRPSEQAAPDHLVRAADRGGDAAGDQLVRADNSGGR